MAKHNKKQTPENSDGGDENVIAQTENFVVWTSNDDGDLVYHVELDVLTLHFYQEDWDEIVTLIKDAEFNSRQ